MTKADIKYREHTPWYATQLENFRLYADPFVYIWTFLVFWNLGFGITGVLNGDWVGWVQLVAAVVFAGLTLWVLNTRRQWAYDWADSLEFWNEELEKCNRHWWEAPDQLKPAWQELIDKSVRGKQRAEEMVKKYPLPKEAS